MSGTAIYEIARKAVDSAEEVTVEQVQLLRDGDGLSWRLDDGPETPCKSADIAIAIGEISLLRDIHPNQITRITATPDVVQELPLVLQPTGDWGDFDQFLWSGELSDEHVGEDVWDIIPHDPTRVLYVNGDPWNTWHTTSGDLLLPTGDMEPKLVTEWATASVYEVATMNSGQTSSLVGLVTPVIVAEIYKPSSGDPVDPDDPGSSISLYRTYGTTEATGAAIGGWITSSPAQYYFYYDGTYVDPKFFVQLFIEASSNGETRAFCDAHELIIASGFEMDYFSRGSSGPPDTEFNLRLNVGRDVIEAALTAISAEDPEYAAMITAARDPDSREATARATRVEAIHDEYYE